MINGEPRSMTADELECADRFDRLHNPDMSIRADLASKRLRERIAQRFPNGTGVRDADPASSLVESLQTAGNISGVPENVGRGPTEKVVRPVESNTLGLDPVALHRNAEKGARFRRWIDHVSDTSDRG